MHLVSDFQVSYRSVLHTQFTDEAQTRQGGGPGSGIQLHPTLKLMLPQTGRRGPGEERGPRPEEQRSEE